MQYSSDKYTNTTGEMNTTIQKGVVLNHFVASCILFNLSYCFLFCGLGLGMSCSRHWVSSHWFAYDASADSLRCAVRLIYIVLVYMQQICFWLHLF